MTDRYSYSRRRMLAGGASLLGMSSLRSSPYEDRDGDGIPDSLEESDSHHTFLEKTFDNDQIDRLDPTRKDLLIDARYVGSASVSDHTKRFMETRFRNHGIHLQWLDYPQRYEWQWFDDRYGDRVENILWPYGSFYSQEVEEALQQIALQIIVLPSLENDLESLYTIHQGENFEGVSFGNRCLITEQDSEESERILTMHEIGHLVLCHAETTQSVMSTSPEIATFTDREWELLRSNLDNIRDSTGFDVAFRTCLLEEYGDDVRARFLSTRDR